MPEIIIPGPAGRIEAKYHRQNATESAPVALILHPHPLYGGTMNNKVTYTLYQTFVKQGFNVMRFNYRGVGKSQGSFGSGEGELSDAAAALDWLQTDNKNAPSFWVAGFSFGAWIAMQLLMRRPELEGFIAVAPPANKYDFNFLAPCPVSGQMIQGTADEIVSPDAVRTLAAKLSKQKGVQVELQEVEGADHFFKDHLTAVSDIVATYIHLHAKKK
ncbi:MAG: alpha/beta hydrolase [Alphaproteobacteria bacterium]